MSSACPPRWCCSPLACPPTGGPCFPSEKERPTANGYRLTSPAHRLHWLVRHLRRRAMEQNDYTAAGAAQTSGDEPIVTGAGSTGTSGNAAGASWDTANGTAS